MPFPISELRTFKLTLDSFSQFTVVVAILMHFKAGACVASSSPLKVFSDKSGDPSIDPITFHWYVVYKT